MEKMTSNEWLESLVKSLRNVSDFNNSFQSKLKEVLSQLNLDNKEVSSTDFDSKNIFRKFKLDNITKDKYIFDLNVALNSSDDLLQLLNKNLDETKKKLIKEMTTTNDEVLEVQNIKNLINVCKKQLNNDIVLESYPKCYIMSLSRLTNIQNKDIITKIESNIKIFPVKNSKSVLKEINGETKFRFDERKPRISYLDYTKLDCTFDAGSITQVTEDTYRSSREYGDDPASLLERNCSTMDLSCPAIEKPYFPSDGTDDIDCSYSIQGFSFDDKSIQENSYIEDCEEDLLNLAVIEEDEYTDEKKYMSVTPLDFSQCNDFKNSDCYDKNYHIINSNLQNVEDFNEVDDDFSSINIAEFKKQIVKKNSVGCGKKNCQISYLDYSKSDLELEAETKLFVETSVDKCYITKETAQLNFDEVNALESQVNKDVLKNIML